MRKMLEVAAVVALIAGGASVASAEAFNGAAQIARGDYAKAERDIVAQRRLYPDSVDLQINLATVYVRTGRTAEARRMYQAVAVQPDEELNLNGRPSAWSHELAAQALRELPTQMAAR